MPRTKQSLKRRAKAHQKNVLKLRKRKNRLKSVRRRARSRPHRREGGGKK
jgi:hypothetical protein